MSNKIQSTGAFKDGFDDYYSGYDRRYNPFAFGTQEHQEWLLGFSAAEAEPKTRVAA